MRKLLDSELNRIDIPTFKASVKTPIVVVLDNIRSLNNIGSVFRSSDAFLISKVFLCGITCCPPHREIQKTALGATESVDWEYFPTTMDCVNYLKSEHVKIVSIEQTDESILLRDFIPKKDKITAIILGNEVKGVEDEVVANSDCCVEIPQVGTKHSLNVSVCTGIVLYDLYQKLNDNKKSCYEKNNNL